MSEEQKTAPEHDVAEIVAAVLRGYELMQRTLWNIAGTSGGYSSWYQGEAYDLTKRVTPLRSLHARSNAWKPGDCLRQMEPILETVRVALLAPASPEPQASSDQADTDLLSRCYLAMRDAMKVIDANEGPGFKHSNILNALAQARVDIETRSAALSKAKSRLAEGRS